MRFKERELKEYAEPIVADNLKDGRVYFAVQFADAELLIPMLEPLIFLGRDVRGEQRGCLYFQNYESYCQGIRYETANAEEMEFFQITAPDNISHIFEYERALDVLMLCSLKRKEANLE